MIIYLIGRTSNENYDLYRDMKLEGGLKLKIERKMNKAAADNIMYKY